MHRPPAALTKLWWQQLVTIPAPGALDRCDLGTRHVVFLAGTVGGAATRSCSIRHGQALLVPLINSECSFAEPEACPADTLAELRKVTRQTADRFTGLFLTIDGVEIPDLDDLRVSTSVFAFAATAGNAFNVPPGPTLSFADGYWALIPPLRPGRHTVSFGGTFPADPPFVTSATYTITVER